MMLKSIEGRPFSLRHEAMLLDINSVHQQENKGFTLEDVKLLKNLHDRSPAMLV